MSTAETKAAVPAVDKDAQESSDRKRKVYIDILRIFACLAVIFNHTGVRGFLRYTQGPADSFQWIASFFFSTFCKTVPLFFMISGALLLGRDESIGKTLRRSVKILIDTILFSLFYFWFDSRLAGTEFLLKDTLRTMLNSNYGHLWYLYAHIALILSLPILRKLVISLDEKTARYTIVLASLFSGGIWIIQYFWTGPINDWLKPQWLTPFIFIYPVTGYIIENKMRIDKRTVCQLWGIVYLCFVLNSICESFSLEKEPGGAGETFIQSFMLINNMAIYVTVKYIFENKKYSDKKYKVLTEVGACTYGIYLFHVFFLGNWPITLNIWTKIEQIGYMGIFISCGCVFILAGVLTWLLRRIPIVRKLF